VTLSAVTACEPSSGSPAAVTMFICANCSRPGEPPTSAGRPRPVVPDFNWPIPVRQVLVPCTGRLQPEHVLKVFESGATLVGAIGCETDNCHYAEGSKRCARRLDHVRIVLQEIGLGAERLLYFSLPGSAAEDMAPLTSPRDDGAPIAAIREQVMQALQSLSPSPLHDAQLTERSEQESQEVTAPYDEIEQ
jgi:F420-non-reducing hydrogenase iron-sulfur subunit